MLLLVSKQNIKFDDIIEPDFISDKYNSACSDESDYLFPGNSCYPLSLDYNMFSNEDSKEILINKND